MPMHTHIYIYMDMHVYVSRHMTMSGHLGFGQTALHLRLCGGWEGGHTRAGTPIRPSPTAISSLRSSDGSFAGAEQRWTGPSVHLRLEMEPHS